MKNLLIIVFILATSNLAQAQFWENRSIYLGFEGQRGNYESNSAFGIPMIYNFNYIYKKHSIQYRIGYISRIAKQMPSDYGEHGICFSRICYPTDDIQTNEILYGRIFVSHKHLRANVKAGISYNRFTTLINFNKHSTGGWLGSSYHKYDKLYNNNIGLILNPSIEFTISRAFGFSLAPYVNINSKEIVYGGQFGIMIGVLRPKNVKTIK